MELEKKRVIFWKEIGLPQRSEANFMLVLNKSLQKAGISAYIKFNKIGYSQSDVISRLLIEKSNAKNFIKNYLNIFI